MAEDLQDLADRPGWTVEAGIATYSPQAGSWCARVRSVDGRTRQPIHVAVVGPSGTAAFSIWTSTVAEAHRVAENHVRGMLAR